MSKSSNVYIRKKKTKRIVKRIVILTTLVGIIVALIIFKTDIFSIESVECNGSLLITEEHVKSTSNEYVGNNLLTINKENVRKEILSNPYVQSVDILKEYPNKLILNVVEKSGVFYIESQDGYKIISRDLYLLENVDSIENKAKIQVIGLDVKDKNIGEKFEENLRVEKVLTMIYNAQEKMISGGDNIIIPSINLEDMSNIVIYYNEVPIYLGNDEDLSKKLSDAREIYLNSEKKLEYIIVRHNGSPDFK